MGFQPFVIGTGLVAWRNLQRTLPGQLETFSNSAEQKKLTNHFAQQASSLTSAEKVVSDYRVLTVALGAYGLQDDLNNRYFIERILAEGVTDSDSLANRLSDSRYERFSTDFAMDGLSASEGISASVAQDIISLYSEQEFAITIGEDQPNLRLALNAETEFDQLAALDVSGDAKWFLVMASTPLRSVMETALGLPSSVGQLDIDKQLEIFRDKSLSVFGAGEVDDLATEDTKSNVIDRFLLRDQLNDVQTYSSQSIALQLLST